MFRNVFAKVVAVSMILAASILAGADLLAQNKPISGTVTDASGVPVIGAAVFVVGNTSTGVMTDMDGKYTLSVPQNAAIAVSCIGYATQTIQIGAETVYNVMLQEDSQLLEETVVIGYGVQKKSDLTGSVASVGEESLKNQSVTDAAAALQGKASGVHIINTGGPGSGATIRVRGYSSNSGNIGPLLIVDGLQVDNIQYLDPSMIASMEVLKDAASAAIYGAQAGNGVVLITTKTGAAEKGRASVTYSGKATLQMFNKNPLMGREDFIKYHSMANADVEYVDDPNQPGFKVMNILPTSKFVENKLKEFDYSHPGYDGGVIDQDWLDAYMVPTWSQQHSLTFSGGNNRGSFFASLNYVNQDGVVVGKKDVYNRLSAQINADYKLFDWMTVGSNMSVEKWDRKSVSGRGYGSSFEAMMVMDPLTPVYWTDPSEFAQDYKAQYDRVQVGGEGRPYRFLGDENGWFANTKYSDAEGSPLAKRDASESTSGGINIRGTLFANITPFKGFTFTSRLGYRINQSTSHSYTAPYYVGPRGSQDNYSISASANTGYYYQWENFANYNVTIARKHSITAMVGMSFNQNNSDSVSASASGPDILTSYEPNFQYLNYVNNLETTTKSFSNAPGQSAALAYFGRLIYSYDNRYSVQANFRADAFDSSKLSAQNRWGYFPSFSAGWRLSEEPFMEWSKPVLSSFKVRGSWGTIGDQTVSNTLYVPTISQSQQSWLDPSGNKIMGTGTPAAVDANITWQDITTLDFGFDARFFNGDLGLTFDWFQRETKNMIVPAEGASLTFGTGAPKGNHGSLRTRGWEVALDYNHRFENGLAVNAMFTLSDAQTEVTAYGSTKSVDSWYVGKTYGEIWGYRTDRLYQKSDFVYNGDQIAQVWAKDGKYVADYVPGEPSPVAGAKQMNKLADPNGVYQDYFQSGNFRFGPGDPKFKDLNGDGKAIGQVLYIHTDFRKHSVCNIILSIAV